VFAGKMGLGDEVLSNTNVGEIDDPAVEVVGGVVVI
jgi:hypothetical protein